MKNFDILNGISDLNELHSYCSAAEDYQVVNPAMSAISSRAALELLVKTVYQLKGWRIGERASLLTFTTDERFVEFVHSDDLMKRIHYVRKTGNNAAHPDEGSNIGRRESYFSVLNLYYIVGSILKSWMVIDELPDFDKHLIPGSIQPGSMTVVPQPSAAEAETNAAAESTARAVAEASNANPTTVEAQPVVSDLTEAETRSLYIDLLLREADWTVSEQKGEIIAGQACIEIKVEGMPGSSGTGYADYVLYDDDGTPLAVVEAKRTSVEEEAGRHQAELYADCLAARYGCQRPVIYYTNGFRTKVIDGMGYPPRNLMGFHTRDELRRLIAKRGRADITNLSISDRITNREYQKRVIRTVCGHYNNKHRRALLVMATGTGKTRVSISMVDVLIRNNWVKNVLFLADRIELVSQAISNYTKLLPEVTVSTLLDKKGCDPTARILFSTYQTMMGHLDSDDKTFTIGRFDLIIIDEAHRSVFGKYGAIFDYFDSLLLGLTATPRNEVDRSTYELFGMEQGEPTDSYEYDEAVADGYLVPYQVISDDSHLLTSGIDPGQLSAEERQQLKELFDYEKLMRGLDPEDDYSRVIDAGEIFRYVFNIDTVDHVLTRLMNDGRRVKDGTMVGKSIIFAYNHKHAMLIAERFAVLYPDLGPDFCRVIDNYERYAPDLIDRFKNADGLPQIAVSVDMLDTGIDVPEVVNLVFFKPVRSKIKFWQMIGRGTRLCPNLYGEGQDKTDFLIFDYYRNFQYFSLNPEGAQPTQAQSIVTTLFRLRTDVKFMLQAAEYQNDPEAKALHNELSDVLLGQVTGLNRNRIDVRRELRAVDNYSKSEAMQCLTQGDVVAMKDRIGPLLTNATTDAVALRMDALVLKSQLSIVDPTVNAASSERKIMDVAEYLRTHKASVLQVMAKMSVIEEVVSPAFWESKTLGSLERVRKELRDLMQYLDGGSAGQTFVVNIKDTFVKDETSYNVPPIRTYRRRVEDYLNEKLPNDPTLQKIRRLEQLTDADIDRLEYIFWNELGTREEFDNQTQANPYQRKVAAFIRSNIGVDQEVALQKYRELIHGATLTRMQEEYLRTLIQYVCENGDIATVVLQQPPFNRFTTIFRENPTTLVDYVKLISRVIAA